MLTKEEKLILTELASMPQGIVLRKLMNIELANLRDVTSAKTWEETLGKQQAIKALEKIITFIEADVPTVPNRPRFD